MAGVYAAFQQAVAQSVGQVIERALEPTVRVAQHWESTSKLAWFGAAADHHQQHVSWSFGRLRDVPDVPGTRHHVGVFVLVKSTFPTLEDRELKRLVSELVPEGTDGATRVFLQRVASQLAVGDVLLTLPERLGCEVSLFARPDAVDTPASTSRWPARAKERVAAALAGMDPVLRARCEALWVSKSEVLLEAISSGL
jgi:hypothetical protein